MNKILIFSITENNCMDPLRAAYKLLLMESFRMVQKLQIKKKGCFFLPCIAPQKETLGGREKVLLSSIKGLDSVWNAYSAVALTLDIKCAASTRNTIPPASGKNSSSFDLNRKCPGTSTIRTVFSFSCWNKIHRNNHRDIT